MKRKLLLYMLATAILYNLWTIAFAQEKKPATYVDLKNGRSLVGWLTSQTADSVVLGTRHGEYRLVKSDITSMETEGDDSDGTELAAETRVNNAQTGTRENPHEANVQGTYVSVSAGYGLSAGSQLLETKTSGNSREGIYGSFGEGFKVGASVGHMFSRNVGAELGLSYLIGSTFEGGTTNETTKRSGSGLMIVPTVIISGSGASAMPYARAGLVIGFVNVKNEITDTQAREDATVEEIGSFGFGYVGGIGVVFASSGSVSFFAELSLANVSYSPSEREVTAYKVNGQDRLSQLTNKKAEFKDSYTTPAQNTIPGVREPFGSFGANIGLRIAL